MSIKIIRFIHNHKYYCVCRAICLISESDIGFDEATDHILKILQIYMKDKNFFRLKKLGWKMIGDSIKPPIFADEEIVQYAQDFLKTEIKEYNIIQIDV